MMKYILWFHQTKIKPIKLSKEYPNIAPQGIKYTMKSLIDNATKLKDIFSI